jgi:hypothetical protein
VDWVSNVAMLELVVTLFLGLLLKVDMIDAEDAESELFTAIVVLLSTFVFFYPMISIIIASERTQKAVVSVFTKLRAKVFTWKKKTEQDCSYYQAGCRYGRRKRWLFWDTRPKRTICCDNHK